MDRTAAFGAAAIGAIILLGIASDDEHGFGVVRDLMGADSPGDVVRDCQGGDVLVRLLGYLLAIPLLLIYIVLFLGLLTVPIALIAMVIIALLVGFGVVAESQRYIACAGWAVGIVLALALTVRAIQLATAPPGACGYA